MEKISQSGTFNLYSLPDINEEGEMGQACSRHGKWARHVAGIGKRIKCMQSFGWKIRRKETAKNGRMY
jgi:hypothetical protein